MRSAVHCPLWLALTLVAISSCGTSKGTGTADGGNTGGAQAGANGGAQAGTTGGAQAGANGAGGGGGSAAGSGGAGAAGSAGEAGSGAAGSGGAAGQAGSGPGVAGAGADGKAGGTGTGVAGVGGTIICGQTNVPLQPIAPDVLILLDNSLSMNDDVLGNSCPNGCGANSKWAQATTAIEDVVMTTQATINWGLKFMDADATCGVTTGVAVDVGPGGYGAISNALALVHPLGDTPTELAVDSAAAYLQGPADPNSKYILLATDGLPNCKPGDTHVTDDDSPGATTALEAARTAGFDTFVLGIATSDATASVTLDAMAIAGGVPQAAGADTSYYLATDTATLEAALTTIAANATPCSFALPPAPGGSTLAISGVTSGGSVTIAKDPANGWAYAADMKSIALDGLACSSVHGGTYTSIVASYLCSP